MAVESFLKAVWVLLFHFAWLGFVLYLSVALLMRWAPRLNAATRAHIWAATLVGLALLVPVLLWPRAGSGPSERARPALYSTTAMKPAATMARAGSAGKSAWEGPRDAVADDEAVLFNEEITGNRLKTAPISPKSWWQKVTFTSSFTAGAEPLLSTGLVYLGWILLSLWALKGCWRMVMLCRQLWLLRQTKRRCSPYPMDAELIAWFQNQVGELGFRVPVFLMVCDRLPTPMAAGLGAPMVLLPSRLCRSLSKLELRQVILHELAHLKRKDDWMNLLQKLIESWFGFHPAVRWCAGRLNLEREMACDESAVKAMGHSLTYASCLVKIFESRSQTRTPALAVGAVNNRGHLSVRVERLLSGPQNLRAGSPAIFAVLVFVFAGFFAVAYAAPRPSLLGLLLQETVTEAQTEAQPETETAAKAETERENQLHGELAALKKALAQVKVENTEAMARQKAARQQLIQEKSIVHRKRQEAVIRQRQAEIERLMEERNRNRERWLDQKENRVRAHELAVEAAQARVQRKGEEAARVAEALRKARERMEMVREKEVVSREMALVAEKQARVVRALHIEREKAWAKKKKVLAVVDKKSHMVWTEDDFQMELSGEIRFNREETGVTYLEKNGTFRLEDRVGGVEKRLEIQVGPDGEMVFNYWENGSEKDFKNGGSQWLAQTLPGVLLESAVNHEARIKNFLETKGITGTFDSIQQVKSEFARSHYYSDMHRFGKLDDEDYQRLMEDSENLSSNLYTARLFGVLLIGFRENEVLFGEALRRVALMKSSFEKGRLLREFLESSASESHLAPILATAISLGSDFEKGRLLRALCTGWNGAVLVDSGFLTTSETMGSSFECGRALAALAKTEDLEVEQLSGFYRAAAKIDSAFELSKLLSAVQDIYTPDSGFFLAVGQIDSDFEKAKILKTVLKNHQLEEPSLLLLLEASEAIDSDFERYGVLKRLVENTALTPVLRTRLQEMVPAIGNGSYRQNLRRLLER